MYTITWTAYLTWSFGILAIYYAAVFGLYFRGRLPFFSKLSPTGRDTHQQAPGVAVQPVPSHPPTLTQQPESTLARSDREAMFPQVHDLVDELQAYIREAGRQEFEKDELLPSIQKIVQKYPAIQGSPFQEGIRNLIAATVEEHCAVRLSADEVAGLWTGEAA